MRVPSNVKVLFAYVVAAAPIVFAHPAFADTTSASSTQVNNFLQNLLNYGGGLLGGVAGVALLWNAYQYITAGGNLQQLEKAKSHGKWTLFGVVVGVAAVTIANTVVGVSSPLK